MIYNRNPTLRDDIFDYFEKEQEERLREEKARAVHRITAGGFTSS